MPSSYPMAQLPYTPPMPAARPSRWLKFRRFLRLIFRRLLYGTTIVGRALRPFALFVGIIVLLLAIIGWMSYELWAPKQAQAEFVRADSLPPVQAVENYLKGQQSFNADMMWDSLSTAQQAARLERGATKATMQAQANSERLLGLQYVRYDYIGGVRLSTGGGMYFYSLDLALQDQQAKFPIVFRSDADGKIEQIIWPQSQTQSN